MRGSVADFIISRFPFQIISAKEKSTRSCLHLVLQIQLRLIFRMEIFLFLHFLSNKQSQITGPHTVIYSLIMCMSLKSPTNLRPQENQNTWFYYVLHEVEQNKPIYFRYVGFFSINCLRFNFLHSNIFNMNSYKQQIFEQVLAANFFPTFPRTLKLY